MNITVLSAMELRCIGVKHAADKLVLKQHAVVHLYISLVPLYIIDCNLLQNNFILGSNMKTICDFKLTGCDIIIKPASGERSPF